jgi:hypothetical protein
MVQRETETGTCAILAREDGRAKPSTVSNFVGRNLGRPTIDKLLKYSPTYFLPSRTRSDLQGIIGPERDWDEFQMRFGREHWVALSAVGWSDDMQQALVYVAIDGREGRHGECVVLDRDASVIGAFNVAAILQIGPAPSPGPVRHADSIR